MKPFKFHPIFKETLWGGDRIAPFKGVGTDLRNIGESWEISGVPGCESIVADRGIADDPDVGRTLSALIDAYREKLVGRTAYERFGNGFPLLVKIIDARRDLSVQVHPNDELARARHGCAGKTEMWYFVRTDPGAKIAAGLRRSVTPDEFVAMATRDKSGSQLGDILAHFETKAGDAFFLPAGRLHSLGAGNFLVEIQQTSDITYRVCDFGRKDAQGRTRKLHVAEARDAIDYGTDQDCRVDYDSDAPVSELVSCPHFTVRRINVRGSATVGPAGDSFVIVVCFGGAADVNGVSVRRGETLLVPADDNALRIRGDASFLTATV